MSHEIIYNRCAIKIDETRYVPVILWGSSNCYTTNDNGREVRSRDWSVPGFLFDQKSAWVTMNSVEERVEEMLKEKQAQYPDCAEKILDDFSYYTSIKKTGGYFTYSGFKSYFLNSLRDAYTIDEARELSLAISVQAEGDSEVYHIKSAEDLDVAHCKCLLKHGRFNPYWIKVSEWGLADKLFRRRKINSSQRHTEKVQVMVDHYYHLIDDDGRYLARYTASGYKYTNYPSYHSKVFLTEMEAAAYASKKEVGKWKVKRIEGERTAWVSGQVAKQLNKQKSKTILKTDLQPTLF